MTELSKKVEEALDTIRPYLETDGGNVELVEITDDLTVKVKLTGACGTCDMSEMTMKTGIEEAVRKAIPDMKEVIAV